MKIQRSEIWLDENDDLAFDEGREMQNPIDKEFDWSSLYQKYDATCKGFNPNAASLLAFSGRPKNDRHLYYMLVDRVKEERATNNSIGLGTYEAILYWKLYSQPAATKNVCLRIRGDTAIQARIANCLPILCKSLPDTAPRDLSSVQQLYRVLGEHARGLCGMADSCALPARSTLLHFLYPCTVPIFDKQVLKAVGVKEPNANRDATYLLSYTEFAWNVANAPGLIPQEWKESPLRLLDMALWVLRGRQ